MRFISPTKTIPKTTKLKYVWRIGGAPLHNMSDVSLPNTDTNFTVQTNIQIL